MAISHFPFLTFDELRRFWRDRSKSSSSSTNLPRFFFFELSSFSWLDKESTGSSLILVAIETWANFLDFLFGGILASESLDGSTFLGTGTSFESVTDSDLILFDKDATFESFDDFRFLEDFIGDLRKLSVLDSRSCLMRMPLGPGFNSSFGVSEVMLLSLIPLSAPSSKSFLDPLETMPVSNISPKNKSTVWVVEEN